MKIQNGTGNGNLAKVDSSFRLHTLSVVENAAENATERQDSFNVNSGEIIVTDDAEQGVLYLTNQDLRHIDTSAIVVFLGPSTGGAILKSALVKLYRNPTEGVLISGAIEADVNSNRNFGSSKTLDALAYKGDGSNSTITNGELHAQALVVPGNPVAFRLDDILNKGDAIAITVQAPTGNTSMQAMAAIVNHLADPAI